MFRACRALGIRAVAVHSDVDAGAPHVKDADEAIPIGPAPARESYLNVAAIVDAARRARADAVHPGYGFLSENAEFADACEKAGVVFIGPPAKAIDFLASGVPLAMNADSSPVEHLARMGFEVPSPLDTERWLSREYGEETRRFGAALRELLSLERIGLRYKRIIEEVLAERRSP